jgi:hypothetical protein
MGSRTIRLVRARRLKPHRLRSPAVPDPNKSRASVRRRWLAVLLATLLMIGSFVLFIYALAAASGDETGYAGGLIGIGLGLVPGVFAVAAWVSQNPHVIRSTLLASCLWLVIALVVGYVSLPIGLVAAYGAGGIVAFRLRPDNSRGARVIAVTICVIYTGVLLAFSTAAGLFAGAPLPFLAIALADLYRERAAHQSDDVSP